MPAFTSHRFAALVASNQGHPREGNHKGERMRLFPQELALANLKGEIPEGERAHMPREEAYEWLKEMAGLDYGFDVAAWERWVRDLNLPPKTNASDDHSRR